MRRLYEAPMRSTFSLALATLIGLVLLATPVSAQPVANPGEGHASIARQLTQEFITQLGLYQRGQGAEKASSKSALTDIAARRLQALVDLLEDDPGEVLRLAIPASVQAGLPDEVRAVMERNEELEGTLEVMYEEGFAGSRLRYGLLTEGEKLELHFAREAPDQLETGTRVRVNGVRVGTAMALDSGSSTSSLQQLTAVVPNTFGEQKTAVILVNFQDNTAQPYTLDYARNVVFTTTSNFYMENSQSQTWLTGDVFGWYTIPVSGTVCDTTSIASYGKQAASAAGANLSAYSRFVFGFPSNACSWWGLGSVGGNPSSAWINGSFTLKVVGHEMGHNLGLYHSRTATNEYGDTLDIMGNPSSGHFNAFQKERLGWLNYAAQPPITTVQGSGDYFTDAYEASGSNPKALKILKSVDPTTGLSTWYYVEHRSNLGFDSSFGSNSNVMNGVVVHTGSESTGNSSYLLDMTPATSTFSDPALDTGYSFNDTAAGVTITTLSTSSTGATVNVSLGTQTCVPAAPGLSAPAQSQWGAPGTPLTFILTLANKDSSSCGNTTFNLNSTPPAGWTVSITPQTVTLSPGANASITVQVTSPANAAYGLYDTTITATNSSDSTKTASATVSYGVSNPSCVPASPSLTATPSLTQAVPAGSSWNFSLTVVNNDPSACAASTFDLKATLPTGWTATFGQTSLSLNPGAAGTVALTVKSSSTASDGSYIVSMAATNSADSTKSGSATVTCALLTPIAATVVTNKTSYSTNEKVSITTTVTAGGAASAGASVAITLTKPSGATVTQNVTTGSNGTALYSYQISRKDPAGTWQVSVVATANSKSAQAGTTFTVVASSNGNGKK